MTTILAHASAVIVQGLWLFLTVFLTRGVFLFLLVYFISRTLPWLPAGFRHSLWFLMICSFLLLPAARLLLPAVMMEAGPLHGTGSAYSLLLAPLAYRENLETAIAVSFQVVSARTAAGGWPLLSLAISAVYLCGAAFYLLRPFAARAKLKILAASAETLPRCGRLMERLAAQLEMRRPVALLVHKDVEMPFTYGFFNPRIVLPASSQSWSADRLYAVLSHELAHVKRGDSLVNLAAYAACAVLWFLPPIWIAWSFMRREAEMSCDLSVLDRGFRRTTYALAILELGAQCPGRAYFQGTHSFFGNRGMLKERILRILRPRPGRARVSPIQEGAYCGALPDAAHHGVDIFFEGN